MFDQYALASALTQRRQKPPKVQTVPADTPILRDLVFLNIDGNRDEVSGLQADLFTNDVGLRGKSLGNLASGQQGRWDSLSGPNGSPGGSMLAFIHFEKTGTTGSVPGILSHRVAFNQSEGMWSLYIDGTSLGFIIQNGSFSLQTWASSAPSDGEHTLVLHKQISGANTPVEIYLDGVSLGSRTLTVDVSASARPLHIGRIDTGNNANCLGHYYLTGIAQNTAGSYPIDVDAFARDFHSDPYRLFRPSIVEAFSMRSASAGVSLDIATTTDTAQDITATVTQTLDIATTTDTALELGSGFTLDIATTTETALDVTATHAFTLDIAATTETALDLSIASLWTLNGGITSDGQSVSTPSNVHSIVNVNDSDGGTVNLSQGGRRYTGTSVSRCSSVMDSGKFYWEVRWVSVASARVGIKSSAGAFGSPNSNLGQLSDEWAMRNDGHVRHNNATPVATGITWNNNDILNVALDVDAGNLWFGENGVWYNSGDPAAGTNPTQTGITGSMTAALDANTGIVEFLFEAVDWDHTAPTGFVAVNSANIIPGQVPAFAQVA